MSTGFDWRGRGEACVDALMQALLASDEAALAGLADLEGRCIAVQLDGLKLNFFLTVEQGRLRFSTVGRAQVDVRIEAGVEGLVAYLLAQRRALPPPPGAVRLSGDLAVAQGLQAWVGRLQIDLEELLSRYWGDVAAHGLFRIGREIHREAANTSAALLRASSDFLQHESGLLVSPIETATFMDEVDVLRERFDRLTRRVERIAALIAARDLR